MSDVEKLYQYILKDTELQARLRVMELRSPEEAIQALIAIADEQGYDVTTEDIHQFIDVQKQRFESEGAELSDEEMALVAAAGQVDYGYEGSTSDMTPEEYAAYMAANYPA